jgi:hypothetical protein
MTVGAVPDGASGEKRLAEIESALATPLETAIDKAAVARSVLLNIFFIDLHKQ